MIIRKVNMTMRKLKTLCDAYDSVNGKWPESEWEGKSVYEFIVNQISNSNGETDGTIEMWIEENWFK